MCHGCPELKLLNDFLISVQLLIKELLIKKPYTAYKINFTLFNSLGQIFSGFIFSLANVPRVTLLHSFFQYFLASDVLIDVLNMSLHNKINFVSP